MKVECDDPVLDMMLADTVIRDRVPAHLADKDSVQRLISHVRALVSRVRIAESQKDEAMRHDNAMEDMLTGVQAENRQLREHRDSALRALSSVEWSGSDVRLECPICHGTRKKGHHAECIIAHALRP